MPNLSAELLEQIISRDAAARRQIFRELAAVEQLEAAQKLNEIALAAWTHNPPRTQTAAVALADLAELNSAQKIAALSAWVNGVAALTRGDNQSATVALDAARGLFLQIGDELAAAQTNIAKLYALALAGEYDAAVAAGETALATFIKHDDELAAGKIEKNLGNVFVRQHNYNSAIKHLEAARVRFLRLESDLQIAMIDNSLAIVYALQNDFQRAEELYLQALSAARKIGAAVTEAETTASLGNLHFFRGRYDDALRFLETSRRQYAELAMPHQSLTADLEIADVYLELNLLDEATAIYRRVVREFAARKMRHEEARARANLGKALINFDLAAAIDELRQAEKLFQLEQNRVGAATVKLIRANLHLRQRRFDKAAKSALSAEKMFRRAASPRNQLLAGVVRAEAERANGNSAVAAKIFKRVCKRACRAEQPQIEWIARAALGQIERANQNNPRAVKHFQRAVKIIERLRAPLPADAFRTAFFADKLLPYQQLSEIFTDRKEFARALKWIEAARSRALIDLLGGELATANFDQATTIELDKLREELNWFRHCAERAANSDNNDFIAENIDWNDEIRQRENRVNQLVLHHEAGAKPIFKQKRFELISLQRDLAAKNLLLLEFCQHENRLAAFVVGGEQIEFVELNVDIKTVGELLERLRFQFGALRYGAVRLEKHLPQLKTRADDVLQTLYELLLRPLECLFGDKNLLIAPVANLHLVPFHALRDAAENYLIERREITVTPSATVWQNLQTAFENESDQVLTLGLADERAAGIEREAREIGEICLSQTVLIGAAATLKNLRAALNRQTFAAIHLACHGLFAVENALFSGLKLADGWATQRDCADLRLNNALVVLSACETGVSKIAAGDELLGLVRGFLQAGARSLILSLWTVNDAATVELMPRFYQTWRHGATPAAALRQAQIEFIERKTHPYFWSPFFLIGK